MSILQSTIMLYSVSYFCEVKLDISKV